MIKRTIKETVSEYDDNGKLIKQTVTETTEDDDSTYYPSISYPINPNKTDYYSALHLNDFAYACAPK